MPSARPIEVDREDLVTALTALKPALSSSRSTPEQRHVWFDGKYVYGYGDGLGVRVEFPTKLSCGVLGDALLGWLQSSSVPEVMILQNGSGLQLKAGRSSSTLPTMSGDDNPWPENTFTDKTKSPTALELTEELLDALVKVRLVKAKASKATRVEFHGVTVFVSRDDLRLYSVDTGSLAQVVVKGKFDPELSQVILPHSFVDQLVDWGKPGDKVYFSSEALVASLGEVLLCSHVLDNSTVEDLPGVVSTRTSKKSAVVKLPEDFGQAIERISSLARGDDCYITLTTNKKELRLSGQLTHGEVEETLPLTEAVGTGEVTVLLPQLQRITKEADLFAVADKALLLYGGGALFLAISK